MRGFCSRSVEYARIAALCAAAADARSLAGDHSLTADQWGLTYVTAARAGAARSDARARTRSVHARMPASRSGASGVPRAALGRARAAVVRAGDARCARASVGERERRVARARAVRGRRHGGDGGRTDSGAGRRARAGGGGRRRGTAATTGALMRGCDARCVSMDARRSRRRGRETDAGLTRTASAANAGTRVRRTRSR